MGTPDISQAPIGKTLPMPATDRGVPKTTRLAGSLRVQAVVLLVLTILAYAPALRCGYVWDDDAYVTRNRLLTAPDGWERIWFSAHHQSQYFPLVYTTLRLERALWGLEPMGYHAVNLLLHALNALLVWVVLRKLAVPGSWLAAAIWAVHPVNVESVAWISELKNTQSTFFYLLALVTWMKFTDGQTERAWRWYGPALGLQALALFSKTTACTLPAAMVLVLWVRGQPIDRRRLAQIAPFLAMGLAMGLVSVWWESHLGNYRKELDYSFNGLGRTLIATRALWFYAMKLVWPTKLTFSYPRWTIDTHDPFQYRGLIGCAVLGLAMWRWRRSWGRGPAAAIAFFVATLSPLLGFIPLYTFRYTFVADHYQYVASIGLIALFVAILARRGQTGKWSRSVSRASSVAVLLVLGALTWRQTGNYHDPETLWRDTAAKNPASWMAHNNLAGILVESGRVSEAMSEEQQALQIRPNSAEVYLNLGNVLVSEDKIDEALAAYQHAVRLDPDFAPAHYEVGLILARRDHLPKAMESWERAVQINPDYADAHYQLGCGFAHQDRMTEAIKQWEQTVQIDPDHADAHNNLALALATQGRISEATEHWEQALRIKPDLRGARCNLGLALWTQGRRWEALDLFRQEVQLHPDDAQAHYDLGLAMEQLGRADSAIEQYTLALKCDPDMVDAQSNLSRLTTGH